MNKPIIVIPVYQPTHTLEQLVKQLSVHFSEIIIVNDGSSSKFENIFSKIKMLYGNQITLLRHYVNLGKGRALKTAFNYCLASNRAWGGVITVDADGQHCLKDILNIEKAMKGYPDSLILGCRQFNNDQIPPRSKFGNKVSHYAMRWLCGINISDTQTGLRGIPYYFLSFACRIEGEGYEYETNMLFTAKDQKIQIMEIPIKTIYESKNPSSHFNPLRDSLKIYNVFFKYSLASLLSTFIDFIVFAVLVKHGLGIILSTYIARSCSAVINFKINRNIVFKYKGNLVVQLTKYITLLIISGTISGLCVRFLAIRMEINKIFLKAIVEIILYFVNYYVQETYIFTSDQERYPKM